MESSRTRRPRRRHRPLIAGVLAASTVASCTVAPWRERIDLGGDFISAEVDGMRVVIDVDTCNGNPEVTLLEEAADEVRVEVTSRRQGEGGDDCLDRVSIELDEPLGDRHLVDVTSGRTLRVDRG